MPPEPAPARARDSRGVRFENSAFSAWQPLREVSSPAASADPEQLRRAYLELLKLSLCDLCGTSTISVWRDAQHGMMSRELRGEDLQIRALGVDWPLQGLTMVGLNRLDDLQASVEDVVRRGVEGDLIEAGTWRGGASILMRATLNTLGEDAREVWVADSFEGFPEPDEEHPDTERLAEVDYIAVPLDEVEGNFARFGCDRGVRFVPGFFHETMGRLRDRRWALVRLDGDSYDATWLTLQTLYPGLSVGGHLIVDDYGALEECRHAVDEFRERHGIAEPLERVDWTCVRWRRENPAPVADIEVPSRGPADASGAAAPGDAAARLRESLSASAARSRRRSLPRRVRRRLGRWLMG